MNLKYDVKLWLSLGRNARETKWKNKEYLLSAFYNRLSRAHVTHETYKQYMKMSTEQQGQIKDVGGFVGGIITGGRRKKGAVQTRQLLTLDLDKAELDLFEQLDKKFNNSFFLHGTHKHSGENPRYRLIVPLNRDCLADEYEAIARKFAEGVGMELFDPTTFQPERLMFWPSVSKDVTYYYDYKDAPLLDADQWLAKYHDWTDQSQWPEHPKEHKEKERLQKNQENPLEKKGMVGTFCRTYGISEAIGKFLSDVYEPTEDGRYTYVNGSTASGLVVYDDLFAYSHHSTDPCSGQLCNAFDLVRIHLFGALDENSKENTPITKRPSYNKLLELIGRDGAVKMQLARDKDIGAAMDFADEGAYDEDEPGAGEQTDDGEDDQEETGEEPENSAEDSQGARRRAKKPGAGKGKGGGKTWLKELKSDKNGNYFTSTENMLLILRNDPNVTGKFQLNLFEDHIYVLRRLPWDIEGEKYPRLITDNDLAGLRWYFETVYEINNAQKTKDAFSIYCNECGVHPLRSWLSGLTWDRRPRIDKLLIEYLGAEDTEITRVFTRKWLIGAVARIFDPGCKFDYMLTLAGPQGIGKSTFFSKLGNGYHSDSMGKIGTKEAAEQIRGVWLMEMGELSAMKKADAEERKLFMSKRFDYYRPAYGIHVRKFLRQCVFGGTTNSEDFLQDLTGNRRFWPVLCNCVPPVKSIFDISPGEINQIWAEATEYYWSGEEAYLDQETEALAQKAQARHIEKDDREEIIKHYLEIKLPENWKELNIYERRNFIRQVDSLEPEGEFTRTRVTAIEIWCEALEQNVRDVNKNSLKPIHDIMKNLAGWEKSDIMKRDRYYGRQICYLRKKRSWFEEPKP